MHLIKTCVDPLLLVNLNSGDQRPAYHQVNRLNAEWCMGSDRWYLFTYRHESSVVPVVNCDLEVRYGRTVYDAALYCSTKSDLWIRLCHCFVHKREVVVVMLFSECACCENFFLYSNCD